MTLRATHEADVSRRTGVTSPIKTGSEKMVSSIRTFWFQDPCILTIVEPDASTTSGTSRTVESQKGQLSVHTLTGGVDIPVRRCGQCDALAPH